MNAKTMAAILEHMDAKSERICMLDEKLRKADEMFRKWKTVLGLNEKLTGPETEEVIKSMVFEYRTLLTALGACPLPRDAHESIQAYALRVGEALKDAKKQWEHDQRRIAQLEKRESELNALHDTIEAVPGFPMQPEETFAEYLQRLFADRAHHADERSRLFTELEHLKASSAQQLDRLHANVLSDSFTAAQHHRIVSERDKALEDAKTAIAEREHFRAKWDASLKARDSAEDEARRTRETNEALQGQITLRSQIIARVMMDPATDKLFNERDWSDAARKVLIDARGMAIDDGHVSA